MSDHFIPPFPTGNTSVNTPYTQVFEAARATKQSGSTPDRDQPRVTASPLHQQSKSPLHHQGSGGSGSRGSSRPGSSHKPVKSNYQSHPSPNTSRNNGGGRSHEGQIGNSTPGRSTPGRKKKPEEQVPSDILPPFPNSTSTGSNYTEVFQRYRDDKMSPTAPPIEAYTPRNDQSPKMKKCSCFGL